VPSSPKVGCSPGHTIGHTCSCLPHSKTLLTGDALVTRVVLNHRDSTPQLMPCVFHTDPTRLDPEQASMISVHSTPNWSCLATDRSTTPDRHGRSDLTPRASFDERFISIPLHTTDERQSNGPRRSGQVMRLIRRASPRRYVIDLNQAERSLSKLTRLILPRPARYW
jgi:hypothetical protein